MSRLEVLELGAGNQRDPDVDKYNDVKDLPGIHYRCDARELPVPDGVFSIVTSNHLIEHLWRDEQHELLRECRRVLATEGMLLIWTPDEEWINDAAGEGLITDEWRKALLTGVGDDDYDRHRDLLTQEELRVILEVNGFRVRSIKEIGGSIECVAFKVRDE